MKTTDIIYRVNCTEFDTLLRFFKLTASNFNPALDTYIDLDQYIRKIRDFAVTFEAWKNDDLLGIAAVYYNDNKNILGYFTILNVLAPYQAKGLGTELIHRAIEFGQNKGFHRLDLEVQKDNFKAIKLYETIGFKIFGESENCYKYSFRLGPVQKE